MAFTENTTIAQIEWVRYSEIGSQNLVFHVIGDPGDQVYAAAMTNPVDMYGVAETLMTAWLDAGNTPDYPTRFQTLDEAKEYATARATEAIQQYIEQLRYFTTRAILQAGTFTVPSDLQQAIDNAYDRYDNFIALIAAKSSIEDAAAMAIDLDENNTPGY